MLTNGIMRLRGRDEVARNQLGTLVDELIKGMLAVGARLAPNDGAGLVIHRIAFAVHVFAVTFHIALLEVRRKPMQILVVGEDSLCFGVEKVVVPHAKQRHDNRDVLFKRRFPEMGVARVGPLEQLLEVFVTDAEYNGKSDSTPQRIPAAYPIPKLEHILRIDTKVGNGFSIGGEGYEMFGHGLGRRAAVE